MYIVHHVVVHFKEKMVREDHAFRLFLFITYVLHLFYPIEIERLLFVRYTGLESKAKLYIGEFHVRRSLL